MEEFGIELDLPILNMSKQFTVISFVNDIDLVLDRNNTKQKMCEILNIFNTLQYTTGGKIAKDKTTYHQQQRQV